MFPNLKPLKTIAIDTPDLPFPPVVQELLERESRALIELRRRPWDQPPGGFIDSDYARAYATLHALRSCDQLRGVRFSEWGSGTGVVTILADMLRFDSVGIEIQEPLVSLSRELAASVGSSAVFSCGSFVPDNMAPSLPGPNVSTFVDNAGQDAHATLGIDPAAVDVTYCYPWPGEEDMIELLFERCASAGAILVTYRGDHELTLQAHD